MHDLSHIAGPNEPARTTANTTARMVAISVAVVAVSYVLVDRFLRDSTGLSVRAEEGVEAAVMAVATGVALALAVIRPLRREADTERAVLFAREETLRSDATRQEFEAALHRAVEMAGTEEAVYAVTAKALRRGTPERSGELLLADSSDAHLKLAVEVGGEERRARCGVIEPRDCPAIRRAQTLTFASSDALDACPHLDGRPAGACSAVCVPVSVAGRSIGVLHTAAEPGAVTPPASVAALEAISTQSGSRIGMLRVMQATHLQAATDPLTGLLNRRSFENAAQELVRRNAPFSLAMGDLDHFKRLNDTAGHDAGDRALRAFAQTLRSTLRADDLICRYGGEEFVIVFPGRGTADAAAALERVQEELLITVAGGSVASFTASFGVAHSSEAESLEDLCRVADAALFRAKRTGRNRVVVEGAEAEL